VPTREDWLFGFKLLAVVALTLWVALRFDLPRPYWALATVMAVAQPLAGAARSKAAYRLYGTAIGAVGGLVMVPNLVQVPELLTLAMATWVGVFLYLSVLDRTPRSYVPMLAGFTAPFVGFPNVGDPTAMFDIAVSRVEEIWLGVICTTLILSIVLPQSVAPAIYKQLEQWFKEAREWVCAVLHGKPGSYTQTKRLRLACGATGLDAQITSLQYESTGSEQAAGAAATLRQHMLMFLPVMSSIHDRVTALQQLQAMTPRLQQELNELADWVATWPPRDPGIADRLRASFDSLLPRYHCMPTWIELLTTSLLTRMKDFIDLRQDARILEAHVIEGRRLQQPLSFNYTAAARSIRHEDHGIALLSAFAAFLAVIIAGGFWIASGWPDGATAPMLAAVACSFFASVDDPVPGIKKLLQAALIALALDCLYLFVILPRVTTIDMLILALAPLILVCGFLINRPQTSVMGVGTGLVFFTLLALQDSYKADFSVFVNSAISLVFGVGTAVVVTQLIRSVGAAFIARRLRRMNRDSLADATRHGGPDNALELAALMLDRIGLVAMRLNALPPEDAEWTAELLSEVRVGIDLVELDRSLPSLTAEEIQVTKDLIRAVGLHFEGEALHPSERLLTKLDACIRLFGTDEECMRRRRALLGLTDLRRSLFPDAPPFDYGPLTPAVSVAA
jgi:uncharacterized membrane protein YccC